MFLLLDVTFLTLSKGIPSHLDSETPRQPADPAFSAPQQSASVTPVSAPPSSRQSHEQPQNLFQDPDSQDGTEQIRSHLLASLKQSQLPGIRLAIMVDEAGYLVSFLHHCKSGYILCNQILIQDSSSMPYLLTVLLYLHAHCV